MSSEYRKIKCPSLSTEGTYQLDTDGGEVWQCADLAILLRRAASLLTDKKDIRIVFLYDKEHA